MPVNIIIDSKFDDRGVKNAQQQLQRMAGDAAKRVAQVGAAVAAAGAIAAGKLAVDAVKAASDFEESVNAVNVAFGEAAQGVLDIGENAAQSMGLSSNEFNQAAVRFSAFAERVVGEGGNVAGFIGDVSQRAADFASVFNIDVSEALQVFQSGLAGEAEPLKRFGINLLQSEVAAFAMANGIAESSASMTEAEKVQARYGLLLEQTAKTAGDFANTSDGLANSQRILRAEISDLQVEIGGALLPVAQELVSTFADNLLPRLEDFSAWINSPEGIASVSEFGDSLVDLFESALDFGGWVLDNLQLLKNLGITIATVTAGVYAYRAATIVAAAAQAGLNIAMLANPVGLLVGAFAALTTGVALFAIGNQNATPTQESLNTQIFKTREQLAFYRSEARQSENSSKLYESTIAELEGQLKDLEDQQRRTVGEVQNFGHLAENIRLDNLTNELDDATGATGQLEEATVRLSIAQQARVIHEDELARAMRAGAMGMENAGQYVRSISEIMDALYAQNRAAREVGEYLPSLTRQVNTSTGSFTSQSGAINTTTEATNGLSSSIVELSNTMSDGVSASDEFLNLMNGIAEIDPGPSVGDMTRELQNMIVELDKADELIRKEGGLFEFMQGDAKVMAQFDEFGNLIRSYTQSADASKDAFIEGSLNAARVTNDLNSLYQYMGITDVAGMAGVQDTLFGGSFQQAINQLTGQVTLTNPQTGQTRTIGGNVSQSILDRAAAEGFTESIGETNKTNEELAEAIQSFSDQVADKGLVPFAKGGIVTAPTRALIGEAGPEAVIPLNRMGQMGNTYVINVNASNRTGGQQAGQEVVKALKQYQTTNGSLNDALTGIGS